MHDYKVTWYPKGCENRACDNFVAAPTEESARTKVICGLEKYDNTLQMVIVKVELIK